MPSYNQVHYIGEAVDSCLTQTDPDWELWILDNSSDDTPSRMRDYRDPRIHFIHEPRRMDPGTCLNELLRLTTDDAFSYVHTDNRLQPDYVAAFRKALAGRSLALAYCDHWVIDGEGRRTGIERRPDYGLDVLLVGHGLGVPFAATRKLAEAVGGFTSDDLADDVLFCDRAWGLGPWIHLRRPLMDYRVHQASRTQAGGHASVLQAILRAHDRALPELESRGHRPLEAMLDRLRDLVLQIEGAAAEAWLRRMGEGAATWWEGDPGLEPLWRAGLVRLPNFGSRAGGPALLPSFGSGAPLLRWPWLKARLRPLQEDINRLQPLFRSLVLGWGHLYARRAGLEAPAFCLKSQDWASRWAAHYLQRELGWRLVGDPMLAALALDLSPSGSSLTPLDPDRA
jgi:glycosyltransferase involved in cell wall biosynthesis